MGKEPNSVPLPRARHRGQEPSSSSWCSLWTSGSTWGLEWDQPWLKKELRAPRAALAGHTALLKLTAALTCEVFQCLLRGFAHYTQWGWHPPAWEGQAQPSGKACRYQGDKKSTARELNLLFCQKIRGKKRRKKWDRKSLFSFFFFKMCTVSENTENQSHFEHKTKGMRE